EPAGTRRGRPLPVTVGSTRAGRGPTGRSGGRPGESWRGASAAEAAAAPEVSASADGSEAAGWGPRGLGRPRIGRGRRVGSAATPDPASGPGSGAAWRAARSAVGAAGRSGLGSGTSTCSGSSTTAVVPPYGD